jgi:pimeloyl-ACP methyl ester carboxylesterase
MLNSNRLYLRSNDTRLCCVDFGGAGSPVLLWHGLANEWHRTAQWHTSLCHVFAFDQREHEKSEKGWTIIAGCVYERYDHSDSAVAARPVLLIGQSMGRQNAFLVAARRPELVRALIVVEARPGADPSTQQW